MRVARLHASWWKEAMINLGGILIILCLLTRFGLFACFLFSYAAIAFTVNYSSFILDTLLYYF